MEDESSGPPAPPPRKMKFTPKVPPRKAPKPAVPKAEAPEPEIDADVLKLIKQSQERSGRPKVERNSVPVRVAFGYGDAAATARRFGSHRGGISSDTNGSRHQGHIYDDGANMPAKGMFKDYEEAWDYSTYYPVTLPLRRPYSGNPELLDEEEFGEASKISAYDEAAVTPAKELGLMEGREEAQMMFFQLPASLPFMKRSATAKGKEIVDNSKLPRRARGTSEKGCSLDELPSGFMGKMLVYESGAIKMKLGDTLFDVSPGSDCLFAQDVVAINAEEKHCCVLGELNKRAIVTPNVDALLDGIINLD